MTTTLKVQLGEDIRRLNIAQFSSYADFSMLVRTLFNIPALNGIQLAYQDEDMDWINIRSDMDMAEAKNYAARSSTFRVHAFIVNEPASSPVPAQTLIYPQLAPEDIGTETTHLLCDLLPCRDSASIYSTEKFSLLYRES